jgi:hypothetical protein
VSQCSGLTLRVSSACTSLMTGTPLYPTTGAVIRPQACNYDNCLRQMIRSSNIFSPFCNTYNTANNQGTTNLPSHVTQSTGILALSLKPLSIFPCYDNYSPSSHKCPNPSETFKLNVQVFLRHSYPMSEHYCDIRGSDIQIFSNISSNQYANSRTLQV